MSMKKKFLSALGLAAAASIATAAMAEDTTSKVGMEKCSIVGEDGQTMLLLRDCKTAQHSCAGKADSPEDFIYMPKGTCDKIKGGVVRGE